MKWGIRAVGRLRAMFHPKESPWPHVAAISYALAGYALAIFLLLQQGWLKNVAGVLLLTHSLVIGAYLVHECAHNTIFINNRLNAALGEILNWLNGACYGRYEDIRHKHFRHHVDRADVVALDFRPRLTQHHPHVLRVIQALEWAYIPAVDIMMHSLVLVLPFVLPQRKNRRLRALFVLTIRLTLFGVLAWLSLKALFLYALAYLLFMHIMRFMDVHQHTYIILETLEQPRGAEAKQFDRAFEYRNTFSNVVSIRHPWLNLLLLNFGFHNAHHARPTAPWFTLPRIHRDLFGDAEYVLSFRALLASYHRHRVARVLNADDPEIDISDTANFIGVVGVSFLTAH